MGLRFWGRKNDFQIMSDLRLDAGQQYATFNIPVCAPSLVLAGDIGRLADYAAFLGFLRRQCDGFQRVFLVLGNHEFYGLSRDEGLQKAGTLEKEPSFRGRLAILHFSRVDLNFRAAGRVIVLGCTLHSFITPAERAHVQMRLKDFQRIKDWAVESHNAEHVAEVFWLKEEIKAIRAEPGGRDCRILVITHYSPTKDEGSAPEHRGHPWSSAFGTDLLGRACHPEFSEVQQWIFGHTHYNTEFTKDNVKVVANQRGYLSPGAMTRAPLLPTGILSSAWSRLTSRQPKRIEFDVRKVIRV